ncbi:hypothetical protein [Halalkalibacter oceani]|uniref:hypothetical protein n=1 Tax=Halalkalibacter oceani TaxID=1653776 RepID=UPI003397C9D0
MEAAAGKDGKTYPKRCRCPVADQIMQVADDICDRVAFINDSELVLLDSPRELKTKRVKKPFVLSTKQEAVYTE